MGVLVRAHTNKSVSCFTRGRVTMNFTVGKALFSEHIRYAILAAGFDVKRSNLIRECYTAQPYLYTIYMNRILL